RFSATQKNLIATDYNTSRRNYIRTGVVPNTTFVTDPVTYISPINGEESNGQTNILLDWADTPGANQYLVIYDRFSSFTNNPVKTIVTSSQYTITATLTNGVTYFWKVWPFNESRTGAMYSATQNFKVGTGTGINEIKSVTDYILTPNPVAGHVNPVLTLWSVQPFSASLKVMDISGTVITEDKVSVPSGEYQLPIELQSVPAGVYFVMLRSDQGNLTERLFISE
ncbi:MAG TPA: T9SS type A sorting domain-containing protein, partial [Saprospiraceae bacterium]|nr:T9SS type A sorting domain-containing protein [Saprospiraceae bacterium]